MKWEIVYEVRFGGLWAVTVDADTKEEAIEVAKERIPDKIEIVRVQRK
jgi:hypothetical protein